MKYVLVLFVLVPFFAFSQKFEPSKNYFFNDVKPLITDDFLAIEDSLRPPLFVKIRDKSNSLVLKKLKIEGAETFEQVWVKESKLDGVKNVVSIVKVGVEWVGCCSYIEEDYYFVTKSGKWVPLPQVSYSACDWPEYYPAYTVPDNQHPVMQEIHAVTQYHDLKGVIYKNKTNKVYIWNGKFIVEKEN